MEVQQSRIEDRRLVLDSDGPLATLADGIYRRSEGESITVRSGIIVSVVPPIDVDKATAEDLRLGIKDLEEQLSILGIDAQLTNLALQSALQKQQQTIQMMSNISKTLHDTVSAIIRKIG